VFPGAEDARPGRTGTSCLYTISERTGRYLERQGLLVRDLDNSYLALEPADETGLAEVLCSSRVDSHGIRGLCFLYAQKHLW